MNRAESARSRRVRPPLAPTREVGTCLDFDIRGVIGVRLLDGSASDAASVRRLLGEPVEGLERAPDVVVRFVETLPLKGATLIASHGSTFTDEGFLIVSSENRRTRAQIPLWELGGPCEIVCESGGREVPLLLDAVKLAALKKGLIPISASAFECEGIGVLMVGGVRGGKTSALLSSAREGGLFVGDGLVFVRADGKEMFGLDTPLTLTARQLEGLPNASSTVSLQERLRLTLGEKLEAVRLGAAAGALLRTLHERLSALVEPNLRDRLSLERTPRQLFADAVVPSSEPRQLFLTQCHDAPDIRVRGVTSEDFIDRVANLLHAGDLPLIERHLHYRLAALGQPQAFVDRAHELRRSLLERAFAGKEAFVLRRPPGAAPEAVFKAIMRVRGDGFRGRADIGLPLDAKSWRSRPDRAKARRSTRG